MSLLEFRKVSLKDGARTLMRGLDVALEAGERLVVFGPSGSGKRAFLKMAAGVLEPDSGTVTLSGPRPGRPAPIGYVTNEGGLISNLTLVQNAALPAVYHRLLAPGEAEERARTLLREWGHGAAADLRPSMASVAAQRLAQFARALLIEPALFVLDTPLEDVDAENARTIRKVLGRIREEGRSAVLGTGSLSPYLDWGGRFLMLHEGRARFFADKAGLLKDEDPALRVFLQ